MRSKFLVLAASLAGVAVAAEAASVPAAPVAPASAAGTTVVPVATRPAALPPRDDGVDPTAAAAATVTAPSTTGTGVAKPAEPDPAQSPFPVQDTLLLLAGLLAMGYVVRRRH